VRKKTASWAGRVPVISFFVGSCIDGFKAAGPNVQRAVQVQRASRVTSDIASRFSAASVPSVCRDLLFGSLDPQEPPPRGGQLRDRRERVSARAGARNP